MRKYLSHDIGRENYSGTFFEVYFVENNTVYRSARHMITQHILMDVRLGMFDFEYFLQNDYNALIGATSVEFGDFLTMVRTRSDVHEILMRFYSVEVSKSKPKPKRTHLHSQVEGSGYSKIELVLYFLQDQKIYQVRERLSKSGVEIIGFDHIKAVECVPIEKCTTVRVGDYLNKLEEIEIPEKREILKKIKKLIDVKV